MAREPARDHTGRKIPSARADGVVEEGILKRDGGQLDKPLFGDELSPEVETRIRNYRPQKAPCSVLWPLMAAFVVRIVLLVCPPTVESARNSMIAVTRFAGWALQEDLELKEEVIFQPLRVEEFTAAIAFLGPGVQGNMRSRLRAIGRRVTRKAPWPAQPTRVSRIDLQPPYSRIETDLLLHDIDRQYKTIKRAAEVTHHLGLGAGLRARVLRVVTADDLVEMHGVLCVRVVSGLVVYYVPILRAHVPALLDLRERYTEGPLIHEWAHRKSVSDMLADFKYGRSTPRLNTWRYRSSWLLSHLALGTRLDVLTATAGVRELRGLNELLRYLPALEDADKFRMLTGDDS